MEMARRWTVVVFSKKEKGRKKTDRVWGLHNSAPRKDLTNSFTVPCIFVLIHFIFLRIVLFSRKRKEKRNEVRRGGTGTRVASISTYRRMSSALNSNGTMSPWVLDLAQSEHAFTQAPIFSLTHKRWIGNGRGNKIHSVQVQQWQ